MDILPIGDLEFTPYEFLAIQFCVDSCSVNSYRPSCVTCLATLARPCPDPVPPPVPCRLILYARLGYLESIQVSTIFSP